MSNSRIAGNMALDEIITVMSSGNPGAVVTCVELVKNAAVVDPDAILGGMGYLLMLDTLRIYDERIYMLWNDVCKRDIVKTIAVIRACQLGDSTGVTQGMIDYAIDNRGEGIDTDAVLKAVKERLPNFNSEVVTEIPHEG